MFSAASTLSRQSSDADAPAPDELSKPLGRDRAIAHFTVGALSRGGHHESILSAARPLARKLNAAGEPGRDVPLRAIGAALSAPSMAVRFFDFKSGYAGSGDDTGLSNNGSAPFHVSLESIATMLALSEREALEAERSALNNSTDAPAPAPASPTPTTAGLEVLVTGATGVAGGAIARHLAASGARVTATSRHADTGGELAACCKQFIQCADLAADGAAAGLVAEHDAVVHADDSLLVASNTTPTGGATTTMPWTAGQERLNVTSTASLLLACRKSKTVTRFIHISTTELYTSASEVAMASLQTTLRKIPLFGLLVYAHPPRIVFREYDYDSSGSIEYTEVCRVALRDALKRSWMRVMDLFKKWDRDNSQSVSKFEFRKAIKECGFDAPANEVDKLFDSMDSDGSGQIDFKELNMNMRQGSQIRLAEELQVGAAGEIELDAKNASAVREAGSREKRIETWQESLKSGAQQ